MLQLLSLLVKNPLEMTEDDLLDLFRRPKGDPLHVTPNMRGMLLRAAKSFYRFAVEHGHIEREDNPTLHYRIPRPKAGEAPSLSEEDLTAVLDAAERIDPRARWTLQLAFATGGRVGSLVEVMPEDVDLRKRWITFRVTKNDDPYGVPLPDAGVEAVQELLRLIEWTPRTVKVRRPTLIGVGTASVWSWANRAGQAAGVKVWPHLLRHTYATRLAEDPDVDIRTWIELLNHKDASLLRRYAKKSDPRLRAAMGALAIGRSSEEQEESVPCRKF
jgi:integrase/recombinase XerD